VAQRTGAAASFTHALGTQGLAVPRVGTSASWFPLTPRTGAFPPSPGFIHWGQTDIFFGGEEMEVSYGDLD
jgi:hypothetical protein